MKTKTIAFYHWVFPTGGAETVTCNLGRYFASHGLRQVVYTRKIVPELLTDEQRKTFEIIELPNTKSGSKPENIEFLKNSLNQERIDVLLVQGSTDFPFQEVRAAVDTKVVFCLHNTPFWEVIDKKSKRARDIARLTPLQKVEYTLLRKPIYRLTDKVERRYIRFYRRLLDSVDRFITLCPAYTEEFKKRIGILESDGSNDRIAAIPNPMLPAHEPTNCSKEKIVLYVGRFQRSHKRVDRLIRIWKNIERRHPDWKLIVVGDGQEREDLEKLTRKLKLRHVEFAGYRFDVVPYYRRATFVCLTSNFEGLPMSLMEGQQYGVIPVSFDSYAGIHEITCNGSCGIAVPAYSLRRYARALDAAMDDEELRRRMSENALRAAERYAPERIGERWLQLFDELLDRA